MKKVKVKNRKTQLPLYEKLLKQLGVAPQSDNGTSAKRQKA